MKKYERGKPHECWVSQNVQKNTIIVQNPLVKIVQKCYYTFVKKIDRGACL